MGFKGMLKKLFINSKTINDLFKYLNEYSLFDNIAKEKSEDLIIMKSLMKQINRKMLFNTSNF